MKYKDYEELDAMAFEDLLKNNIKLETHLEDMQRHYNNELNRLQTKLCKVKTLIYYLLLDAVNPDKTISMSASLDCLYKALEVINE